jgi:hypothetical protein
MFPNTKILAESGKFRSLWSSTENSLSYRLIDKDTLLPLQTLTHLTNGRDDATPPALPTYLHT